MMKSNWNKVCCKHRRYKKEKGDEEGCEQGCTKGWWK